MEHTKRVCEIILISHGKLAEGMLESARFLLGEQRHLIAYGLPMEKRAEDLEQLLRKEVREYGEENVLILSDIQYGTPFNAAVAVAMEYPAIHHITGMNLAVVLSAVSVRNSSFPRTDLDEICDRIISETSGSIVDVRKLLAERLQEDIEEEEIDL